MMHPCPSFFKILLYHRGGTGSEPMVDEKLKEAFLRNLVLVAGCRFLATVSGSLRGKTYDNMLCKYSITNRPSYISFLNKSSTSLTSFGRFVYLVGTVPSLKHSKITSFDSGTGSSPVSASIFANTMPSGA